MKKIIVNELGERVVTMNLENRGGLTKDEIEMKTNVGIIGCGYMGRWHADKIRSTEFFDLLACYDSDDSSLESYSNEYKIKGYSSINDFLQNDEINLVFICTPNDSHKDIALKCIDAGKHVLCEKPVMMSYAEVDEVIEKAKEKGLIFTSHQNRRWDEDYLIVKKVVESGEIGKSTTIISRVYGERGVCFGWRAYPEHGGGMLLDWGVHLIDQMLQLMKDHKVESVYARLESILTPSVDDTMVIQLKFDNGMRSVLKVGTFCLQKLPRWIVYGDRGTLSLGGINNWEEGDMAKIKDNVQGFDSVFGKSNIGPSRTMTPLQPEYLEKLEIPEVVSNHNEFYQNLMLSVRGKAKPLVSFRDMRRVMKVIDCAKKSAEIDEVVKEII